MSTVKVNELSTYSGTDISIETGKTIAGTASQFKMTGGSSGQYVQTDGSGGLSFATVAETGFVGYTVYTSSDTWSKSTNSPTKIIVEVQAAGGSGAYGSAGANSCSGSGGGYVRKLISDLTSITSGTITIGSPGAGQTSANTDGNDASDTTWTDGVNTLTAGGGKKGPNSAYGQAVGGTATGGDYMVVGGIGAGDNQRGGGSQLGYPGMPLWTGGATSGAPMGYGAASGGSYGLASADGGVGVVIVWEYK